MPWREMIFTEGGGVVYPASWDMNAWQASEISKRLAQLAPPDAAPSTPPKDSSDRIAIQDSQDLLSTLIPNLDHTG